MLLPCVLSCLNDCAYGVNSLALSDLFGDIHRKNRRPSCLGSTIGQPADLPRSQFGLRSRPSAAAESGEVIKRDQ